MPIIHRHTVTISDSIVTTFTQCQSAADESEPKAKLAMIIDSLGLMKS